MMSVAAWLDTPVCSFISLGGFKILKKLKITTDGHGWNLSISSGQTTDTSDCVKFTKNETILSALGEFFAHLEMALTHTHSRSEHKSSQCVWHNQRIRTHITKTKSLFFFISVSLLFFPPSFKLPDTGYPKNIYTWISIADCVLTVASSFLLFTCPFHRVGSVIWIAIGGKHVDGDIFRISSKLNSSPLEKKKE